MLWGVASSFEGRTGCWKKWFVMSFLARLLLAACIKMGVLALNALFMLKPPSVGLGEGRTGFGIACAPSHGIGLMKPGCSEGCANEA